MASLRVLISGAGIAGPTLAWWLAKSTGAHITIVEKAPRILPYGQNVDIQGSALKVIERMGLLDAVKRANTGEKGTRIVRADGSSAAEFPIVENAQASFSSQFEILRGDLSEILCNSVKDLDNVNFVFGTSITKVLENSPERVRVELSDGRKVDFDILVAADGQWSKVRKQCLPEEWVKSADQNMYAVYWTIPRLENKDDDFWNIYLAGERRLSFIRPDPHGTMRAGVTFKPSNNQEKLDWERAARSNSRKVQYELVRRTFHGAGWQVDRFLGDIDKTQDFYFQSIQQIRLDKWSNGRVVCLGDTAWAPTPLTGMGTSLAISGSYVLAGELSKRLPHEVDEGGAVCKAGPSLTGGDITAAFEAYESEFRPFVKESQWIVPFLPTLIHVQTYWGRWLLLKAFSALAKVVSLMTASPATKSREGTIGLDGPQQSRLTTPPEEHIDYKLPSYLVFSKYIAAQS